MTWIIPDKFWKSAIGFTKPERTINQKVIYRSYGHGYVYNPFALGHIKNLSSGMWWKIQDDKYNVITSRSHVAFIYELNYENSIFNFIKGDSVYILDDKEDRIGIVLSEAQNDDGLVYYKVLDGNKKIFIPPCALRKVK